MTVQELLRPRIKLIADWPGCEWAVGTIFPDNFADFKKWPHLFQELPWYAERKAEDMPEYVKVNTDKSSLFFGHIEKVTEWFMRNGEFACRIERRKDSMYSFSAEHFLPATESEYLQSKEAIKQIK